MRQCCARARPLWKKRETRTEAKKGKHPQTLEWLKSFISIYKQMGIVLKNL